MDTPKTKDWLIVGFPNRLRKRPYVGRPAAFGCCVWLAISALAGSSWPQDSQPAATQTEVRPVGQAAPPVDVPAALRGSAGRIQYVGPDTFILLDGEGRPQPVPGMSYEDFLTAWKQIQEVSASNRQPRYVIEDVHIDGTADERRAKLKFELKVWLLTKEPVAVPLGLGGSILEGQPSFGQELAVGSRPSAIGQTASPTADPQQPIAPATDFLAFDPARGGWVAWFSGQLGGRHTLSLEVLVPLSHDGAETTLPIASPRSLVTRFSIDVRSAAKDFSVTSGTVLSQQPTADGTRLEIAGPVGQFALSWKAAASAPELGSVLAARGAIQVSIDGRSVRTDAAAYGAKLRRQIRPLPHALACRRQVDSRETC